MVNIGSQDSKVNRPTGYDAKASLKRLVHAPNLNQKNLPSAYKRELEGYTRLQDTHYKGYTDKKTEAKGLKNPKGSGDYSRKLQFLMKQAEGYNKNLSGLRKYSVSQLREAEGMYPEYGQYDKVKNSGWVRTKPSSLKGVDGLSIMDKILIGDKNPFTQKRDFTAQAGNEMVLNKILKNRTAEGGDNGPRKQHIDNFNKQLITHLKDYSDLDHLEKRNDPISKLVKTQMENLYDRLDYLTDDEKLQDLTGVDLHEDAITKVAKGNMLAIPMNSRGVPSTWIRSPDYDFAKAADPKNNDRLAYIGRYMLNNPMRYYIDRKTKKFDAPYQDFINPIRGVSKLTQDLISGHQNRLSEFAKMNPEVLTPAMRQEYLENEKIFGKGNRVMPIGADGLMNITNQRGDGSGGLHSYRPVGMDIIEHFGRNSFEKPSDYKGFLSKLYADQKSTDSKSNGNKLCLTDTEPFDMIHTIGHSTR